MWFKVLIVISLLLFSVGAAQPPQSALMIRVLLGQQSRVSILMPSKHSALFADGTTISSSDTALEWRISVVKGNIGIETATGIFETGKDRLIL